MRRVITWQLGRRPAQGPAPDLGASTPRPAQELEEEIFGKHVLITDHDDWPVPEVIAGYRSQSEAEFSFRQMKDPHVVSFSPMYHWTEHNIRVHVFTCVLALQIAHLMRRRARQAGLDLSVRELLRPACRHRRNRADLPLRRRQAQGPPDDSPSSPATSRRYTRSSASTAGHHAVRS